MSMENFFSLDGDSEIAKKKAYIIIAQKNKEKRRQETLRQETLKKMRVYKLHASEVDMLEEAGEL